MADGNLLSESMPLDDAARAMLAKATEKLQLSGRGYHRLLRVAATIADLADSATITAAHLAEAIAYRRL
jgi:magnesium chelatase family protein